MNTKKKKTRQSLSNEQKNEIKQMAIEGKTPGDISARFKTPISSIHAMKKAWTERDGIVFPNLRGKRGANGTANVTLTEVLNRESVPVNKIKAIGVVNQGEMKFIIDGKPITIGGDSRSVSIEKDRVVVQFN